MAKLDKGSAPDKVKLFVDDKVPSVNEEFNQYMEYYMQLIRMKSEGNVLIVEDDLISSMFIEKAIKEFSSKLRLFTATSEEDALKILAQVPCDLVIADYYLDGPGTGLDLCRKIRALSPHTRCVMTSGMSFYEYLELARRSEVKPEFIEKPISKNSIKSYLTEFFDEIIF